MELIQYFLNQLHKFNFKVKLRKCSFFDRDIQWLGYSISADGFRQPKSRTSALTSMPAPTSAADLTKFLGAVNWISKFLGPHYSSMVAPLLQAKKDASQLVGSLKKSKLAKINLRQRGLWTDECHHAWQNLLQHIHNCTYTLAHPDISQNQINVFTDASDLYYGGMLTQTDPAQQDLPITDRDHRPIGFFSGAFRGSMLNWSTLDKEAFAIISCIEAYSSILYSTTFPFHLYTDHKNLAYIFSPQSETTNKATTSRVARWNCLLGRYHYDIHHIPGEANLFADILSRIPTSSMASPNPMFLFNIFESEGAVYAVDQVNDDPDTRKTAQHRYLKRLADFNPPTPRSKRNQSPTAGALDSDSNTDVVEPEVADQASDDESIPDDVDDTSLAKPATEDQAFDDAEVSDAIENTSPDGDISAILQTYDASGRLSIENKDYLVRFVHMYDHAPFKVCLERLRAKFVWNDMDKDVQRVIDGCRCKQRMDLRYKMNPTIRGWMPNGTVRMDFLRMPKSKTFDRILVMKDDFSLYCLLIPCSDETSATVVAALSLWASISKFPKLLVVDRQSSFLSRDCYGIQEILFMPLNNHYW